MSTLLTLASRQTVSIRFRQVAPLSLRVTAIKNTLRARIQRRPEAFQVWQLLREPHQLQIKSTVAFSGKLHNSHPHDAPFAHSRRVKIQLCDQSPGFQSSDIDRSWAVIRCLQSKKVAVQCPSALQRKVGIGIDAFPQQLCQLQEFRLFTITDRALNLTIDKFKPTLVQLRV